MMKIRLLLMHLSYSDHHAFCLMTQTHLPPLFSIFSSDCLWVSAGNTPGRACSQTTTTKITTWLHNTYTVRVHWQNLKQFMIMNVEPLVINTLYFTWTLFTSVLPKSFKVLRQKVNSQFRVWFVQSKRDQFTQRLSVRWFTTLKTHDGFWTYAIRILFLSVTPFVHTELTLR